MIASWTDVEYHGWDWAVCITGILQFGLAWIIIGWAWSIWWGVRMYQDANNREKGGETLQQQHTNPEMPQSPSHTASVDVTAEETSIPIPN